MTGRHAEPVGVRKANGSFRFHDHRQDQYKDLSTDYSRARHRAVGPPDAPTLYDFPAKEFTSVKGAGGRT